MKQLWGVPPDTVLAGAVEVVDTTSWGTHFVSPTGDDISICTRSRGCVCAATYHSTNNNNR